MTYWSYVHMFGHVHSNIELSTQYFVLGNKSVWYGRIDVIFQSAEGDLADNLSNLNIQGITFAYVK